MGALTGNAVKDTYLDLVQLGKSGAGLPSHAGKEAALYDGSGAQILGRTAVSHWLDPLPYTMTNNSGSPFAETWEFSTTGDMTQAALEAAGWTFENCTASVGNGLLKLTATSSINRMIASLAVSFAGDFDVVVTPIPNMGYGALTTQNLGGVGVADYRPPTDVAHYVYIDPEAGYWAAKKYASGTYASLTGSVESDNAYSTPVIARISRVSGNVYPVCGSTNICSYILDTTVPHSYGFTQVTAISDSSTFNKLFLAVSYQQVTTGDVFYFANIRRFQ